MAYTNSSRALAFLTETSEDAIAALKGLIGGNGSAKYLDTSQDKVAQITSQIDSSSDEDRIEGLSRIVAMISKGRDASHFLPGVLKLTSCSNMNVRKLVYIILLRYANANPDLTLLSINSFQRDLSDPSPLIRAMALRVLSSIKVKMVSAIVLMSVSKATRDPNLYVRKIAALAIPKCYDLDKSQLGSLLDNLSTLLSDRSPLVLGAAICAFQELCPDRWDLLHQHYRKICHALLDIDEWSQITCLQVLSRYARANLAQPKPVDSNQSQPTTLPDREKPVAGELISPAVPSPGKKDDGLETFLQSDTAPISVPKAAAGSTTTTGALDPSSAAASAETSLHRVTDKDLDLLVSKTELLLCSRNPAVVMAAVKLIFYLGPPTRLSVIARPLIRLMRSTPEIVYLILLNSLSIARIYPDLFAPYVTCYFLGASHEEPVHVSLAKLDMLVTICSHINVSFILPEIVTHVRSASEQVANHAVGCLGKLASKLHTKCSEKCLSALLDLVKRKSKKRAPIRDSVIAKAVLVIQSLIQSQDALGSSSVASSSNSNSVSINPTKAAAIVVRLAPLLFGNPSTKSTSSQTHSTKMKKTKVMGKGAILHPSARASILWLLGQYARQSIRIVDPITDQQDEKTLAELVLPDILRRCAINFANEASIVKLQILTVSTKVFTYLPTVLVPTASTEGKAERLAATICKLHFYLLRLARYDLDFDVRDRARLCKGLTWGLSEVRQALSPVSSLTDADPISQEPNPPDSISQAMVEAIKSVQEWFEEEEREGDIDLKGVRLRREQVLHILFEGKSVIASRRLASGQDSTASHHDTATDKDTDPGRNRTKSTETSAGWLGSLSLALDGKLIKGWSAINLPDWTDEPTLPLVREPPPLASTSTLVSKSTLSNSKSISSSDFISASPLMIDLGSRSESLNVTNDIGSATDMAGSEATSIGLAGKYRDLDSFLDESESNSESEDQLVIRGAPEDSDYLESSDSEEEDDDDDNSQDEEEEEEEEED